MKTSWDELKKRRKIDPKKWGQKYCPTTLAHLNEILYSLSIRPLAPTHPDVPILLGRLSDMTRWYRSHTVENESNVKSLIHDVSDKRTDNSARVVSSHVMKKKLSKIISTEFEKFSLEDAEEDAE